MPVFCCFSFAYSCHYTLVKKFRKGRIFRFFKFNWWKKILRKKPVTRRVSRGLVAVTPLRQLTSAKTMRLPNKYCSCFPILANNQRLHATRVTEGSPGQTGILASKQARFCSRLLAEKIRVQILWNSGRRIKVASDLIVLTMKALFPVQQTTVNICGIKLMAVKRFPFTVGDVLQLAQSKTFSLDFFSGDISNC